MSDGELKEKGRERAVTNLAAEAWREKGRRGERLLGTAGALGGLAAGASVGKGRTGKAIGAGLGYLAGGKLGKTVGEEVDIHKNAAPLELIRKMAEQTDPTVDPQLARKAELLGVDRQIRNTNGRLLASKVPAALLGAGVGGVAGGVAGGLASPGAMGASALLGSSLGYLTGNYLGGGEKANELEARRAELSSQRRQIMAKTPGAEGPLTDENLDRDGYAQARADAAQAKLDLRQGTALPSALTNAGAFVGTGLGAYLGSRTGNPVNVGRGGTWGALGGAAGGALLGSALTSPEQDRANNRSLRSLNRAEKTRDDIWGGTATMPEKSAAPLETIRKVARAHAFEELAAPSMDGTETIIMKHKLASASDPELLKIALLLPNISVEDAIRTYEQMGGDYQAKVAFGNPMFNAQQMQGSPALQGGMNQRAQTPMPQPQQAQPVQSPATASPRQQMGGVSAPSAMGQASQSSAPAATPAAAPAPTVSVSMGG